MSYQTIQLEREEGVAIITLNRPEVLNAISRQMREELAAVIAEVRDDPAVKAVIITGAGRAFCAGGDVKGFGERSASEWRDYLQLAAWAIVQPLFNLEKPVIAAVNGYAVGAGCNLALACDLIIASEEARFSEIFARIGLIPDFGGHYLLPRRVGLAKAKELVFTAQIIEAREAQRIGLVNQVVPAEQLMSTAKEWAQRLAQGPTKAIGMAKQLLNQSLDSDLATMLEMEAQAQAICFQTEDHKEGARAFWRKGSHGSRAARPARQEFDITTKFHIAGEGVPRMTQEMMTKEQCVEEVRTTARLVAELYYHFAKALIEKYGEEGKELVRQVIWDFGRERGAAVREKVKALGLPLTPDNYTKVPDLPRLGWESEVVESTPKRKHHIVHYCPFAALWKELGAEELGIIYCEVDPAKYSAYNPKIKFTRTKSMLQGAPVCDMVAELEE